MLHQVAPTTDTQKETVQLEEHKYIIMFTFGCCLATKYLNLSRWRW